MNKPVRYSNHAIQRMFERDINEKQVAQSLKSPDYTRTSFSGRKVAVKKFGSKILNIVYIEDEKHIKVITIY